MYCNKLTDCEEQALVLRCTSENRNYCDRVAVHELLDGSRQERLFPQPGIDDWPEEEGPVHVTLQGRKAGDLNFNSAFNNLISNYRNKIYIKS